MQLTPAGESAFGFAPVIPRSALAARPAIGLAARDLHALGCDDAEAGAVTFDSQQDHFDPVGDHHALAWVALDDEPQAALARRVMWRRRHSPASRLGRPSLEPPARGTSSARQ